MNQRSRAIAIVGAGFSGAALAVRLLRNPPPQPCRIVLIDRAGRFGSGLAYSSEHAHAQLNVPAARMSIDERAPDDFLDYLRTRGILAWPEEFISRDLYGDYLEARLADAVRAAPPRIQLTRITGTVVSVARLPRGDFWNVELLDGRSILADTTVLALGHFAPRIPEPLRALADSPLFHNDPWRRRESPVPGGRVLLVGTGLTMTDVANDLSRQPNPPREILAVSRRGLLSLSRREAAPNAPAFDVGLDELLAHRSLRAVLAGVHRSIDRAAERGVDWRDVMVGLRERAPAIWKNLGAADRGRFARHLQPYWDVHRHQLAPRVGDAVRRLMAEGKLGVRAARIVSARAVGGQVQVGLRFRGQHTLAVQAFDQVINCSGPDVDPRRAPSDLVQFLLSAGLLVPDATGVGIVADERGRPVGSNGLPVDGLYYLGPWLRARDFEATAVHELRLRATELAAQIRRPLDDRRRSVESLDDRGQASRSHAVPVAAVGGLGSPLPT